MRSFGKFFGWQSQTQVKKQEQTVDQDYANSTLFMAMSTLQEIQLAYQGGKMPKEFGNYDHCDYSYKNLNALKSQLQTHLTLIEASINGFKNQYGNGAYKLPKNYNEQQVLSRLQNFYNFFQKVQDRECQLMCQDFSNILSGKKVKLNYKNMVFKDANKTDAKGELASKYVRATYLMKKQGDQIRSRGTSYGPKDLTFKNNQKFENQYQKRQHSTRKRPF